MDFRKSLSKTFKKLKDKLPGDRRKRDGRSGDEDDRKGTESDVEGSGASQRNSYLHSEVDAEGAPGREGANADGKEATLVEKPPTSTSSILQGRKHDST